MDGFQKQGFNIEVQPLSYFEDDYGLAVDEYQSEDEDDADDADDADEEPEEAEDHTDEMEVLGKPPEP